jgi:predicted glycoside hydrolase/deacetylase ChbG (UPF0249 family)
MNPSELNRHPAISFAIALALLAAGCSGPCRTAPSKIKVKVETPILIRCDDIGLTHSVNAAFQRLASSGINFSASILPVAPAFEEAAAIAKQYPNIAIGIHLALNSEWKNLKWGPAAGAASVPSLVDSDGHLFGTVSALRTRKPSRTDVETELRAQIQKMRSSGLCIDYMDYHMAAVTSSDDYFAIAKNLAAEYRIPMAQTFNETIKSIYYSTNENKTGDLARIIERADGNAPILIPLHISEDSPQMDSLADSDPRGIVHVGRSRSADFRALLSAEFQDALIKSVIRLVTYRELDSSISHFR